MPKKSKWEKEAKKAVEHLQETKQFFSRSGLYLTSLLLTEVARVAEYEVATETERYRTFRKRTK